MTPHTPDSLAAQLYLLAYDADKGRADARWRLGKLLRAAALTDLLLDGHLTEDRDGDTPRPVGDGAAIADPVNAEVWRDIVSGPPDT